MKTPKKTSMESWLCLKLHFITYGYGENNDTVRDMSECPRNAN